MFFKFEFRLMLFSCAFILNIFVSYATAHPSAGPPSLFSVSLSRSDYNVNATQFIHGSIVQQQHANRGIKRLASMTGQKPPSDFELLFIIYERLQLLSIVNPKKYKHELELLHMLIKFYLASLERGLVPPEASSFLVQVPNANSTAVGPSSLKANSSFLHSIGLDVELNDIGYIAHAQIGTPRRDFRLLVDSGSSDLWVGAEGCRADDGGTCGNHMFLGAHSSKSFNASSQEWAIGYVTGSVVGVLAQDDITIAGLTLSNHPFGVALNESSDFTPNTIPFDGLLGLAKSMLSQQGLPTLPMALYQAQLISAPIVSYKLPRSADGTNDGEMTLGGMDPKKYNTQTLVHMKNVNKFGYWGVAVDAIYIGKKNMKWSNVNVVMDTGTTLIIAPQMYVDAIHALIPGAQNNTGSWMVPCNMTTVLSLTIGGQSFSIDPRDMAFYPDEPGSSMCMSGIAVGGVGPFYLNNEWLLGDVFLKNVYFSTDESWDRISMAKSIV